MAPEASMYGQQSALGLALSPCLFLFISYSCNSLLAWLHSNCAMALKPMELSLPKAALYNNLMMFTGRKQHIIQQAIKEVKTC